jgi:hypothetical protein
MVYAVTQSRVVKMFAVMLAISQLFACGGGTGSNDAVYSGATDSGQVSTGTSQSYDFTLSWVAPVARADGSPISLTDIDGYNIYYGTSAGSYPNSINVADGSQTSTTVTGVMAGTYYVVMTTYDTSHLESVYSQEIIKTAQ